MPPYFFLLAFHEILLLEVFFFMALVHWALVGRHAGYPLRFSPFFLPHGLPVLQSIQPLPPFFENQVLRLLLLLPATFFLPVSHVYAFFFLDLLPQFFAPTLRHLTSAPEAYALGQTL